MTILHKQIHWEEKSNDGQKHRFYHDISIHPYTNGKIVINIPGVGGSKDGYQNKYLKIAEHLTDLETGSVVRMSDPYNPFGWENNLRQVINYAIDNSSSICGSETPVIYLMGYSAGASAASILAWEYLEITKMLFLEPAPISNKSLLEVCLSRYTGDLTVVTGSVGGALGPTIGSFFIDKATSAKDKNIFTIPNCDHHFSGETNGRIMSQAPLWAFSDSPTFSFPDIRKGIALY